MGLVLATQTHPQVIGVCCVCVCVGLPTTNSLSYLLGVMGMCGDQQDRPGSL